MTYPHEYYFYFLLRATEKKFAGWNDNNFCEFENEPQKCITYADNKNHGAAQERQQKKLILMFNMTRKNLFKLVGKM